MSPREYLSHIRCTRAYELIVHTDMKFVDIAANTGFCCANDMSRENTRILWAHTYGDQVWNEVKAAGRRTRTKAQIR